MNGPGLKTLTSPIGDTHTRLEHKLKRLKNSTTKNQNAITRITPEPPPPLAHTPPQKKKKNPTHTVKYSKLNQKKSKDYNPHTQSDLMKEYIKTQ